MNKRIRKTKSCTGCSQSFITYKNYDYCPHCTLNHSRYVPKIFAKQAGQFKRCPECGDGSGIIKFPSQPPRLCKLCTLSKNPMNPKEEPFWEQVNYLAQEKIYHLLTTNLPFQNIKLIKEPYSFEDRQQKLSGLFLTRDTDYRTLLVDIQNAYAETELPTPEQLAEEITVNYFYLVFKALLTDLSDCYGFDPSYFSLESLTN